MTNSKWIKLIILAAVFFFLWSIYIKLHVRYSIHHYLSEQYGIKGDFTFLSYDNNWLEGIDYQRANRKGKYTIISRPNPDDLQDES